MPELNFFQVTAQGLIGTEAIDTVFHYYTALGPNSDPTVANLTSACTAVKTHLSSIYRAAMLNDYVLTQWHCRGWQNVGAVSESIPVTVVDGGAGGIAGARDGTAHVIILKAGLGTRVSLVPNSSLLRRAYFAFGPIQSTNVSDNNQISIGTFSQLTTLITNMIDGISLFGTSDLLPIKVSHTVNHEVVPQLTAYRPLTSLTPRSLGSLRKSRTNGR